MFVLLAIVLLAGPALAVTLFVHTFPATPAGAVATLTSTCGAVTLQTATPITGTAGGLRFDCGPAGITGVTALSVSATPTPVTPTFGLPTGATGLSLVAHVTTNAQCSGGTALTTNTPITPTASASLDYCLAYTSYPVGGIGTFTVTWAQ